jgi:hypothetical protein
MDEIAAGSVALVQVAVLRETHSALPVKKIGASSRLI